MGRKNYKTRDARKRQRTVEYVLIESPGDYDVTMSNGSGFKTLTFTGTSVSCWNLATRMGLEGGIKAGEVWTPREIKRVGNNDAVFSVT